MSDRCSGFEARHASRKLKLLTVIICKATGGLGEQQAAESHLRVSVLNLTFFRNSHGPHHNQVHKDLGVQAHGSAVGPHAL